MLRLVPKLHGMSHSQDLLLSFHWVADNRLRREALLLDASCEAGQMPLSRWILAGVLHSARNPTRSSGFCQTTSITGKRLMLSPSSTRGHCAQVQVPSTSRWLGSVKWVTGSLWWEERKHVHLDQPSERQKLLRGGPSPRPDISRSLGKNLLCSAWEGWNNMQKVFTVFPNLAFLVVKLLPALLPVCMPVTGEHH